MAEFRLRIWAEQVLFDCIDYIVEADTLEEAVELLRDKQEEVDSSARRTSHPAITRAWNYEPNEMRPLDPEEVVGGDEGIALIAESGDRVRDLVGVPTGCGQLGEALQEANDK